MKLKLLSKRHEMKDIWSFVLETPKNLKWKAGQFMFYNLPHQNVDREGDTRYFTISAAPYEKNISITTRVRETSFKQALFNLKIGDSVDASGPDGEFVLSSARKNYIFLAGGIGITPFRSMLFQLDHEKRMEKIKLVYANRTNEIFLKEELNGLATKYPDFNLEYVVDPERIDENYLRNNIETDTFYYISGPEPYAKSVHKILEDLGINKKYLVKDYFPNYESY